MNLQAAYEEEKGRSDVAHEKQLAGSNKKELAFEKQIAELEVKTSGLENALSRATEKSAGGVGASAAAGNGSEVREGSEYTLEGHVSLPLLFRTLSIQLVCALKLDGLQAGLLPVPCPSFHLFPLFSVPFRSFFLRRSLLTFDL